MTTHRFVMPYAQPNYELPIADWFEEAEEAAAPPATSTSYPPAPSLYRQTGARK